MRRDSRQRPIVFLDFDGTISERDVIDVLLEAFADPQWLEIETEWQASRIGSRRCLSEQMSLVRATREQINALLDSIEVDRGFGDLLEVCAKHCVPVHIVSDGFDYCIRRILARAGARIKRALDHVNVYSSKLKLAGEIWRVEYPYFAASCSHGCATCKPAVMRQLNPHGARAIFVGDGLSDRYATHSADLVFAKGKLADYCRQSDVPYVLYEDLGRVAVYLESLLSAETFDADASVEPLEA